MIEQPQVAEEESGEWTNKDLTKELLATIDDGGALVEEPLDSGLWPTVELSEGAVKALVEAMHGIQRREEETRRKNHA